MKAALTFIFCGMLAVFALYCLSAWLHEQSRPKGRLLYYPLEKEFEAEQLRSDARLRIAAGEDEASVIQKLFKDLDNLNE